MDAVQLELGIPLRWPGTWRARFLAALDEALPAMIEPQPASAPATTPTPGVPVGPGRLQFTGRELCGLVAVDRDRGGRLLLFTPEGGLVLFTGERLGLEPAGTDGPFVASAGNRNWRSIHMSLAFHSHPAAWPSNIHLFAHDTVTIIIMTSNYDCIGCDSILTFTHHHVKINFVYSHQTTHSLERRNISPNSLPLIFCQQSSRHKYLVDSTINTVSKRRRPSRHPCLSFGVGANCYNCCYYYSHHCE